MAEGAVVVQSLDAALADSDLWVVGGAQIYTLAMSRASRCAVTEVDICLPRDETDVFTPVLDEAWVGTTGEWQTSSSALRYRLHSYSRS